MAKKVYAYTDTVPASTPYLTAGKRYEVDSRDWGTLMFKAIANDGGEIFCLWESCAHLEGGNWTREEVDETP